MILLLEDDPAIADTVAFALRREGFDVEHRAWLAEARERLRNGPPPQLLILDIGLPDGHGLDLCRELRQGLMKQLPVIVLSARSDEMDRVLGLELGLLTHLLAAPRRIHSRDALLDAVWGSSAESADRTVDTHIKTLRAKLREAAPTRDPIKTHRGLGYSLEP